jgi:Flp pilus assembly pilin Flp
MRNERGQAAVELVVLLPLLAALLAAAAQGVIAGHSWWMAASAARAAARAEAIGAEPLAAARRALPGGVRRHVRVRVTAHEVVVRLPVPALAGIGRLATATASVGRTGAGS